MTTKLALIELHGPFWTFRAVVPAFGLNNVEDKLALQEDRILPVRTLLADAAVPEGDAQNWRRPRLMSMHLIAGAREDDYRLSGEELRFDFPGDATFRIFNSFDLRTVDGHEQPERAAFQHVTVEPLFEDDKETWPRDNKAPAFRLVAGAIHIAGTPSNMKFLGPLKKVGNGKFVVIRLTPDGVEVEREAPFPGRGKLPGRFLLHVDSNETRLRLLTERQPDNDLESWRKAWFSVTAKDDTASRSVVGLKVEGRRDARPPSFLWHLNVKKDTGIQPLSASVDVPAEDLEVRLLSPRTARGIDGEVTLKPDAYTLAALAQAKIPASVAVPWTEAQAPVVLFAELKPAPEPDGTKPVITSRLRFDPDTKHSVGVLAHPAKNKPLAHRCAHDEVKLAGALRRAYGLDELLPGIPDPKRPMLAAFTPLDDGWLQLPVPNVPPPNVNKDDVVVPATRRISNVLSGYLRFAQTGNAPAVLSAFGEPLQVGEAPWVVTVEGAKGAAVVVGITPHDDTGAQLTRAAVALDDPELSMRGLVWFSADRPDELEALPRIGAGAGAYFDVPLDTYDIEKQSAVQFTLGALALDVSLAKKDPQTDPHVVTREQLGVEVAFDTESRTDWQNISAAGRQALEDVRDVLTGTKTDAKVEVPPPLPPVRWQRHPLMPLAAEMPMTRGAAASVRPLESRDLVPFVLSVNEKVKPFRWVVLRSEGNAVFARIDKPEGSEGTSKPVKFWPWPQVSFDPEHGIALAAFGVPGAELSFDPSAKLLADPWPQMRFALRYDIPALDEAFATATLPPQPAEKALPEERELPPPPPVPVAHDWVTMKQFWAEQDRRHQVARVAHSYLVRQTEIGKAKTVSNLVDNLPWKTKVDFTFAQKTESLPYGSAIIGDGGNPLTGNTALLGAPIPDLEIDSGALHEKPGGPVKLTGYAPASFKDANGFLFDSRLSGIKAAVNPSGIRWCAVNDADADVIGLATLTQEVKAGDFFTFWFKDLPVGGDGSFNPPTKKDVDFEAWQDGHFVRSGFEWRLIPATDANAIFLIGRDRVPFFGFSLEPLRLKSCVLTMASKVPVSIRSVEIEARISLGPLHRIAAQDGNVVTLKLVAGGGGLVLEELTASDLELVLHPSEGSRSRTRITTSIRWDKQQQKLVFDGAKLFVTMFGEERTFNTVTITAKADEVKVVTPTIAQPSLPAKAGMLIVHDLTLTVTNLDDVKLTLDRQLHLMPQAAASSATHTAPAAIRIQLADDAVKEMHVLGTKIPGLDLELKELDGALTVRTKSAVGIKGDTDPPLLKSFPIAGTFTFGLVARIGTMADGIADLTAGYLDGEIVASASATGAVKIDRVSFHAERARRVEKEEESIWRGDLRFYGTIELTNAIVWPEIESGGEIDPDIPFPGSAPNGRKLIEIEDLSYMHAVTYTLDGHAMPYDVSVRLDSGEVVWTMPVVASHTLVKSDSSRTVSFTSVETIALGTAAAIVPKPKLDGDSLTFGPRRANTVVKGEDLGKPEPGMIEDRIGRIGTVLSGALGLPFRKAFWPQQDTKHPGLFVAGGFVGLLVSEKREDAPLLRLPVFAPLEGTLTIRQKGHGAAIEVAWTDSRAARNIIATLRGAVAPASTSDAAIRTALLAGSRAEAIVEIAPDATVAAVLVEQSFVVMVKEPDLELTPFFIAAAVSLSRTLRRLESNEQPTVLSLIAGYGLAKARQRRGLASAIVTRNFKLDANKLVPADPELATIGDSDLVVRAWTGPAVADLGTIVPVAQIAGPAFADHVHPRAVLLRTTQGGQSRYDAPQLPRPFERPHFVAPVLENERVFADAGRGYALPLGGEPERWLRAPEEIGMQPFRDADLAGDKSGLAGLSRMAAMPAHATDVSAQGTTPNPGETNDPVRNGIVWVAQSRAPVYLPLALTAVKSLPVPWLTPATPRPRHPAGDAVVAAFAKIDIAASADKIENVQPVLPAGATIASVGDRAGISLARVMRLETALGNLAAFDGRNARFGRPAQGGAWIARTERTPRPGILPKNRDAEDERLRRPCASRIIIDRSVTALAGPADRVSGEANSGIGAWTVTFVAAREWEGMITESWDGTLRLRAEVEVDAKNAPTDVLETLVRLVFPTADNKLLASASLMIGDVSVPFLRVHFGATMTFQPAPDLPAVMRGAIELILDARPSDPTRAPGAALRAIADALANDVLPPVQVQLVVHPESRLKPDAFTPPTQLDLTQAASKLAAGDARAPVTLRMPLAPVIRSRGALPLASSSLLFIDPSYNAGLSSQPAEARERIKPIPDPPKTRGALAVTLYCDRRRVNRKASVTFMVDLAFEKKLDDLSRDLRKADGDIVKHSGSFQLVLKLVRKGGGESKLFVARPDLKPEIKLATVYELPLSSLVDAKGAPAAPEAGDVLILSVTENGADRVTATVVGDSTASSFDITQLDATLLSRAMFLVLTDEPVAEPPSALYAALVRRTRGPNDFSLSLPLYAQSPLPWRVDLRDAKNDFRRGLMTRAAQFVWSLSRPKSERNETTVFVVKTDRNGQLFLPDDAEQFEKIREVKTMSSWKVELRSGSGKTATIDLIDKLGPLNDWTDQTPGAFDPASGTFTNQLKVVKPSIQPSWLLNDFDIDDVKVGSTGPAEVLESGTDFPNGNMPWVVVAKL